MNKFIKPIFLYGKTLNHGHLSPLQSLLPQRRRLSSSLRETTTSPVDSNILRILNNRIELESEYPLFKPPTEFNSFSVQSRLGIPWVTMSRSFGDREDIKIETASFDAAEMVQDSLGQGMRLHLSLVIDIQKKDNSGVMKLLCSAWPDSLEVRGAYIFKQEKVKGGPYTGHRKLDAKMQSALHEFLEERGIDGKLAGFLHEFMTNQDRIQNITWLLKVKIFLEDRGVVVKSENIS